MTAEKIYKPVNVRNAMATFHVLIEQDEDSGFIGRVPELQGCVSQGETLDELMNNMKEAIQLCLESSEPDGKFVGVQEITV